MYFWKAETRDESSVAKGWVREQRERNSRDKSRKCQGPLVGGVEIPRVEEGKHMKKAIINHTISYLSKKKPYNMY